MDKLRLYKSVTLYKEVPEEMKKTFELSTRTANDFYCFIYWKGQGYYAHCVNISTQGEMMGFLEDLMIC